MSENKIKRKAGLRTEHKKRQSEHFILGGNNEGKIGSGFQNK